MNHQDLLRATLAVAKRSLDNGNLPFGCLLADASGTILEEGENTVVTDKDAIAHCEINLVHQLAGKYEPEFLRTCTLYASTEPCPMCTGAIYWSGIGKIVYALGKHQYHRLSSTTNPDYVFDLAARELLQSGGRHVKVEGPALEAEATAFYRGLDGE